MLLVNHRFIIILSFFVQVSLFAQENVTAKHIITPPSDTNWYTKIESVNFPNIALRDILQGLAIQNNLNCVIDDAIRMNISIHLNNIIVWDLFQYLAEEYNLSLEWSYNILKVSAKPAEIMQAVTPKWYLETKLENSLLSIECRDFPINKLVDTLVTKTV